LYENPNGDMMDDDEYYDEDDDGTTPGPGSYFNP
jgi:regulator of RNase E activity RraB